MNIVLTVLLPLGLMTALLPAAVQQLRGATHPSRLLAETLTAGFVLLVCSLLVSMPGWVQLLWWGALVTALVAAAVTTWRTATGTGTGTGTDAGIDPGTDTDAGTRTGTGTGIDPDAGTGTGTGTGTSIDPDAATDIDVEQGADPDSGPGTPLSRPASAPASGSSSKGPAGPDRLQPIRRSELLVNSALWTLTIVAAVAGG